jgi:hypothetical protein
MTLMSTLPEPTILKRDVLGRVTTPLAQKEALLDEFERSGMNGVQFAKWCGVNYQTFASWLQKRRRQRSEYPPSLGADAPSADMQADVPSPSPRFLEVVVPHDLGRVDGRKVEPSMALELELPGGARLSINSPQQAALAAALLNALHKPC